VTLKLLLAIAKQGMPALKQAVASGQYDFPKGLFFGGNRPSSTSEVLAAQFDRWLGHSRRVMHLDFHTGLGAWATPKLLIDYPLTQPQRDRFSRWFGPNAFESTDDPNKIAYPTRGSFGQWCLSRANGRDYMYAAAEFGTSKPIQVLAGLRAENQAHHWGQPADPSTERAKRRLVELFCPRARTWRSMVIEKSRRLVTQAIDGLVGEP
jgi:hypothetical protein